MSKIPGTDIDTEKVKRYTTQPKLSKNAPWTGRPTKLTPELIDEICERVSNGEMITRVCNGSAHMPSYGTLHRWMAEDKNLLQRIQAAKDACYECLSEELTLISKNREDSVTKKTITNHKGEVTEETVEFDNVPSRRLQIDTMRHLLGLWNRSRFGTKVDGSPYESVLSVRNDIED